jgi:hypothetical protein
VNVRLAQHALARHFNYFSRLVVRHDCHVHLAAGEVHVRAGYLVEVEIKASVVDWNADRGKSKWEKLKEREKVSCFYYAVPTELVAKKPAWIPPACGLIELQWSEAGGRYSCLERIRPQRTWKVKLNDRHRLVLLNSAYHRFWQRELGAIGAA